jgi:hypothetical protein
MTWDQSYEPHDVPVPGVTTIPGIGGVEKGAKAAMSELERRPWLKA